MLEFAMPVPDMPAGVHAFTTTRQMGSFGLGSAEPVGETIGRWSTLQAALRDRLDVERLVSAHQVHGAAISQHGGGWSGWLRQHGVDGHLTTAPGTALAVTVADCTPVFVAHPAGAVAALHAGWRGTAASILPAGLALFDRLGFPADECWVHLGPAICGGCYEVGPEVLEAVRGVPASGKGQLDVRAVLMEQAAARGVRQVSLSEWCTRCHNDRFFSHRAGDGGRQVGVITLSSS